MRKGTIQKIEEEINELIEISCSQKKKEQFIKIVKIISLKMNCKGCCVEERVK